MLLNEPAQFIQDFISDVDSSLTELKANAKLTQAQKIWLGVLTNICLN